MSPHSRAAVWLLVLYPCLAPPAAAAAQSPPNIIVILCDDLGYGDLSVYGHPTIRTPHLDRMAAEGNRFTDFYSAAPVCTPSRAGLLTGRVPLRSGMVGAKHGVLFPASLGGLPAEEVTIAELLKERGYATACVGKWHLGHLPPYLPMRHGFDAYFGIPYSNDMGNVDRGQPPTPLMRNEEVIEAPCDQTTITRRYTDESIDFIRRNRERPFFLYLAHTFPHVPLYASEEFRGTSARGPYGDVVEELDANVGRLLQFLRDEKLDQRTLVVFTSDNGPWLSQRERGGSAGLLRNGKTTTWEGGMRVPAIAWWPGRIEPDTVTRSHASVLDLLPTCAELAGAPLPKDVVLDGASITSTLLDGTPPPAPRPFFFYQGVNLNAVRRGPWKLHVRVPPPPKGSAEEKQEPPLLFHLERDPSERFNVAKDHPQVVAHLTAELERHRQSVVPVKLQLDDWATTQRAQR